MTKPPAEKRVLAWDGKQWVRAIWVEKHTKEQDTDSDWHDYCEANDTYYWPEGWYEVQTHGGDEMFWHITDGVQEWQEMPSAPGADHVPDAGKKVDEAAMARLHENGAKAWAFLGDRSESDWVDGIRGNEDTCSVLIEGDAHEVSMPVAAELLRLNMLIQQRQDCEPFGYFRAEPFGWTNCAPDAEGAIALYAAPPKREPLSDAEKRRVLQKLAESIDSTNIVMTHWLLVARAIEKAHGIGGQP